MSDINGEHPATDCTVNGVRKFVGAGNAETFKPPTLHSQAPPARWHLRESPLEATLARFERRAGIDQASNHNSGSSAMYAPALVRRLPATSGAKP